MVIDIGSLLHAGRPVSLDDSVAVPAFGAFSFPQPARIDFELQREGRGIQINGGIDVGVTGECGRCLEETVTPIHIDVDERFDPPGEASDPFGDNNVITGTDLDVGDLVRQLVTAALPFGLTCSAECRGLCASCGLNKNTGGGCHCPEMEGENGEP